MSPIQTHASIAILLNGDEAVVRDNPHSDDLVTVRPTDCSAVDIVLQGTLADVTTFLSSALAEVDEIAATREILAG